MAHVELLTTNNRAAELRNAAKGCRVHIDTIKAHVATMTQMLTGESSELASYDGIAAYYAIEGADAAAKRNAAKLLFDEASAAAGNAAALVQFAAIAG